MSEAAARESTSGALGVTLAVAFACALLVSTVAVKLRPVQQANIEAERVAQLELALEALSDIGSSLTLEQLEARIVALDDAAYDDAVNATTFDAETAATRPESSVAIPAELDVAGLRRRARHARVYLVHDAGGELRLLVLPVSGRGYQSTLYAWLVIDGDLKTVRALKVYRHGETPGVGARIEEPEWERQWRDLPAWDDDGVLRIGVRSAVGAGSAEDAFYQVDGISGATRTAQGVDGMLRFWLGDFGFGPFIQRLAREGTDGG